MYTKTWFTYRKSGINWIFLTPLSLPLRISGRQCPLQLLQCAAHALLTEMWGTRQSSSLHCDFAKFWTPHFPFLDSTLLGLDSTFWLDSTLKLNYDLRARQDNFICVVYHIAVFTWNSSGTFTYSYTVPHLTLEQLYAQKMRARWKVGNLWWAQACFLVLTANTCPPMSSPRYCIKTKKAIVMMYCLHHRRARTF